MLVMAVYMYMKKLISFLIFITIILVVVMAKAHGG